MSDTEQPKDQTEETPELIAETSVSEEKIEAE